MARTKGSLNRRTNSLVRALDHANGTDLLEKLALVGEDTSLPLKLQLDALKHLSGAMHGRIRLHHAAKKQLQESMA
jgi:hypothetical protein